MTEHKEMLTILERQRAASLAEGQVSAKVRIDRIDRAINLLQTHGKHLREAMSEDFGHRSMHQSKLTDIGASISPLKHAKKNIRKWMRPEKRSTFPFSLLGGRGEIQYQPLGVIGCISPWNFPVQLTFSPLAGIFAAGNRAMIKPSELTPHTSELMQVLFSSAYDEQEVALIVGDAKVGIAFSSLPFDHLLFTGANSVAKHVMRAAADNLVPVTLELGGKSPVIIGKSADVQQAARSIMAGKTLNAGQICLAPDYVFVPEGQTDVFVEAARDSVTRMYANLKDNPDYTSIVNERHYDRLADYIDEARSSGAEVVELNPADDDFSQQQHHRIPPTLILNPEDDLQVMQEEIFGPILPVKTYSDVEDPIRFINERDRPLGLYYFGKDSNEEETVLNNTTSGGVTVNDVIMHIAQEELPFGGVGSSGMGAYHGHDGFKTFSHGKAVYRQSKLIARLAALIGPPYR